MQQVAKLCFFSTRQTNPAEVDNYDEIISRVQDIVPLRLLNESIRALSFLFLPC